MIKISFKKFVSLLLLMAFSSQLMAATVMTCELENIFKQAPVHANHMNHAEHMSHSMESHDVLNIAHNADNDHVLQTQHKPFCCKTMDHCLLGCALIAINNYFFFQFEVATAGIEDFYSSHSSSPFLPSLYRPPIFG